MKLYLVTLIFIALVCAVPAQAENNLNARLGEIEASLSGLSVSYQVNELSLASALVPSKSKILDTQIVRPVSGLLTRLLSESIGFIPLGSPTQFSCTSQVMGAEYRHDYQTQDGGKNWSQFGDGRIHLSLDNVQSRASLHDKPKSAVLNFHSLFNVSNFWGSDSLRYPATMTNRKYLDENVAAVSVSPSSTEDANPYFQLSVHQSVKKWTSNDLYQDAVVQFNPGKDGLIQSIRQNVGDSTTKEEITIRTIKFGDYRNFPACKFPLPTKIEVVELVSVPVPEAISVKARRDGADILKYTIKRRVSSLSLLDVKHIENILTDAVLPAGMLFMDTTADTSEKLSSPMNPFSK